MDPSVSTSGSVLFLFIEELFSLRGAQTFPVIIHRAHSEHGNMPVVVSAAWWSLLQPLD